MKNKYIKRKYSPGDEEEIVHLLQIGFNGWPQFDLSCSSLDHWRWKYLDNPTNVKIINLTKNKNRIIACQHGLCRKVKIGEESFLCSSFCDHTVHPDFRRQGISEELVKINIRQSKEIGVQFIYFDTAHPTLIKRHSKTDSRFPHPIIRLGRILDITKHLRIGPQRNSFLIKLGFHTSKLVNKLRKTTNRFESLSQDLHISEISNFDDNIDIFWDKIRTYYSFIVERNKKYLNWRYCNHRSGDYLIRQVEDDGQLLGYSVLRINRYHNEYPVGFIVDLLAIPQRLDIADTLVADAVNYFDENDINAIFCLVVKNHPYERIFKKYSFLEGRKKPNIFYNALKLKAKLSDLRMASASKVHFSYGDRDSI